MEPDAYDDLWRCRFGFWHVVPGLAADCTGRAHGIEEADDALA